MAFFDPATDILLISSTLAILTKVIQKKFLNMDRIKANQKAMKEKQARMKELMNKQDSASQKELDKLNQEIMETLNETMQGTFKQMAINLPIFLGAYWFMGQNYAEQTFILPVQLPWFTETGIGLVSTTNWFGWYFLSYLVASLVLNLIIKTGENFKK